MAQVAFTDGLDRGGVDEGAIEIEDEQADAVGVEGRR